MKKRKKPVTKDPVKLEAMRKRARHASQLRWKDSTKAERSEHAAYMASFSEGRPRDKFARRCGCKRMTLKRATLRGKSAAEHDEGCEFHPATTDKS